MPLPPALLQRLAKRGLVDKPKSVVPKKRTKDTQLNNEEIIAENYDDVDDHEPYPYDYEPIKKPQENFWSERLKRRIVDGSITGAGYKACPNKYNLYHKCTLYCMNTFGDGIPEPSRSYTKRKQRLLRRYPLPKDWTEVYDFGCGVHYYWQTTDDMVSWLPPGHPKASINRSAAAMRKELEPVVPDLITANEDIDEAAIVAALHNEVLPNDKPSAPALTEKKHTEPEPIKAPPPKKPKARDLEKTIRSRSERQRQRAETGALDPMDPAAYSNVPRGKWSAGLEAEGDKTGVDSTATGPLFQMRPYPSPGAILAANKAKREADGNDSGSEEEN